MVAQLYCGDEKNINIAERELNVEIVCRDNWMQFNGTSDESVERAVHFFELLGKGRSQGMQIHQSDFLNALNGYVKGDASLLDELFDKPIVIKFEIKRSYPGRLIKKGTLDLYKKHDIVFGIGPAGTGKTYIAVAAAIQALLNKEVDKIIISRPAVEAGEALGFFTR